jgi:hypothetical protein
MEGCTLIVFVELKSGACVATKEQKQVRAELRGRELCAGWRAVPARADGAARLGRGLPPSTETAAIATMGGTVHGRERAAAAGAGRGGAATGGTAAVAGASARP